MATDLPRTYKHQLTAKDFVFAFTATEADFASRADELRQKGVERLTVDELCERLLEDERQNLPYILKGEFTYLADVEIVAPVDEPAILLANLNRKVPHLLLIRSKLPSLTLTQCTLADSESDKVDCSTIHIIDSTTGYFRIEDKSTTGYFWIDGASTTGYFGIHGASTTGNFHIDGASKIGDCRLSGASKAGDFSIYGASITGQFWIDEASETGGFKISESSRTGRFWITNSSKTGQIWVTGASKTEFFDIRNDSTTGDFIIDEASTTGSFWIEENCVTGNFGIEGASTTGSFSIKGASTTGNFRIINSHCTGFDGRGLYASFFLQSATISQFRLTDCYIPELEIRSGCKLEAHLTNSQINLIDFRHLTLNKESTVSLFNCKVYACLMEEFAVQGQLYLRQLQPLLEPFSWYDPSTRVGKNASGATVTILNQYLNYYRYCLIRLKGTDSNQLNINESTFRIAQSSLGKTEFTSCDLGDFRFEFNNAKITEVFMSGGTVPQNNIVIYGEQPNTLAWEEQKVSVYNQLKKIFDGQGDIYWATTLQAKTAEHQEKLLRLRRQGERNWFSTTFWDLTTFRFNRWSNLHGESWGRALAFTLVVAAVFYLLFLLAIGRLFKPTAFDWALAGQYFQFLDPTHKPDFVKQADLSFGAYAADFVGRIFIGYGIFQFVAAFRKHGKK